ncbi:hypothetical protein I550_5760 [Mycobacterium intracellulare 1956]|uniref:DUF1707 domain-containing protein n=1 Tax=Mycobacterium intracellulare 1956 TaxID=1299331 RepID=X8CDC9_MYCIT|nr:hypothetical protein I550_5760 [Mycobacterium intracellulare 1956]
MAKWLGTPLAGGLTATTRARDSDRQDTCTILDNALSDGEVSAEEHRERVSAATKAVTLGDLQALVRDLQSNTGRELPALDSRPGGRGWPGGAHRPPPSSSRSCWAWGSDGASTATPARRWTSPRTRERSPTASPPWS